MSELYTHAHHPLYIVHHPHACAALTIQALFSLGALLMLTLHKTLTHVEPKLFVGSFVVCATSSCAYLAKHSGMGELDISGKKVCRVHPRPPWTATSYSLISHTLLP